MTKFLLLVLMVAVAITGPGARGEDTALEPAVAFSEIPELEPDEEPETNLPLSPAVDKSVTKGFRYGTVLEYWFLEPGQPFTRMPDEPSLTGMVDDGRQLFSGAAMLRDAELKGYTSRQGVLQWTTYFRAAKAGKYVFALAVHGLEFAGTRYAGAAMAVNGEVKAVAGADRDQSAVVEFAAPGWYRLQIRVWWSHEKNPVFPDYSVVLKVREPDSLSLRGLNRKELYYKLP